MSQLLEHAVAELRKLPAAAQDVIAALILEEIEDDRMWEAALARSPSKLTALAAARGRAGAFWPLPCSRVR